MNNEPRLRPVTMQDAELILEWVNDPLDRANSYSSEPITLDEHLAWLKRSLSNPEVYLYMMTYKGEDVGHIKLYVNDGKAEIGYCIAPNWRGRGLAKVIVALMTIEAAEHLSEVQALFGCVKRSNPASRKAFQKVGYAEEGPIDESYIYKFNLIDYPAYKQQLLRIVEEA